jgi:predicted ester cyclase
VNRSTDNKAATRAIIAALNAADYDALDQYMAADFVRHCQATPEASVNSLDEFKRFDAGSRGIFPDQTVDLERIVGEDEFVAFWAKYRGTQDGQMGPFPPSHKRVDLDFAGIFRFAEGKAQEVWLIWDNMAMLEQLGHIQGS